MAKQLPKKQSRHILDVIARRGMLNAKCPEHYEGKVTPWDLQRCMRSTGNAFVDARRADAIEYAFRLKGDLKEDLKKAIHCLQAALDVVEDDGL